MTKCAYLLVDNDCYDYYEENEKFYIKKDEGYFEISKLFLAQKIGSAWSEESIFLTVEENNDEFLGIIQIIIYDFITFSIFKYGKTKEEALNNINKFYRELLELNYVYEQNIERNKRKFMSKLQKFAFINKNYTDFGFKTIKETEYDLVFFKDSNKTFRELVVEYGVPNDARADEPIFGYVFNNKLIFFKHFFRSGEQEDYIDFIIKHKDEIIKHYKLSNLEIYSSIKNFQQVFKDEEGYPIETLISDDFDYYYPYRKLL